MAVSYDSAVQGVVLLNSIVSNVVPHILEDILPYAPGELQMESETEGCLYPCVSHLSSGRCEQHTTRPTIVLAFWQICDNAILILFRTS
jgi:hypothetical protein